MAESPSSALPGGVQWLPAIGGAHLLRAEVGRGEPPTLVLQSARGEEHRITAGPQTRFNRSADFLIPAGLRWAVAVLVWQDGTRAVLPDPPAGRAEVIDLASRRVPPPAPPDPAPDIPAPLPWTAPPWEAESAALPATDTSRLAGRRWASPSAGTATPSDQASVETAIPASRAARAVSGTALAAGGYQTARADLKADLSRAVEALSHAHETEQVADSAVKAIVSGAESDLQAERAARAADLSVLGAQSQLIALRAELDRARTEITQLRTALESERLARVAAEAALGSPVPPGDLTELASQQTEVAASAPRRSPEEADRLVAALEAAANSLRATVPSPTADDADGVRSQRSAQRTFATAPTGPTPAEAPGATGAAPADPVPDGLAAGTNAAAPADPVPDGLAAGVSAAERVDRRPDGLAAGTSAATLTGSVPDGLADRVVDPASADAAPDGVTSPAAPVVDHRPVIVATVAARAAAEAARQALAPVVAPAPGLRRALLDARRARNP